MQHGNLSTARNLNTAPLNGGTTDEAILAQKITGLVL
jgi:hypothetical protein